MRVILICLTWCVALASVPSSRAGSKQVCPAIKLKNGRARYRHKSGFAQNSCDTGYLLAGDKYMKCQKGVWEGVVPYCVRPSCQQRSAPRNGAVFPSHRGGVMNFYCLHGFELVGPAMAFCDGKAWSTHLPVCTQSNKTISVSCNFETEDICGWTHDLNHNFDWIRHQGSTPSAFIGTGPTHDHTLGYRGAGFYMYIEASGKNPYERARLISPMYPAQVNRTCLTFWYHMYGASTGSLNVHVRKLSRTDWQFKDASAVWSGSGEHGNQWLQGFVDLGVVDEDFQVVFEAVRGSNYESDTAIDDVALLENCVEEMEETTTTTEETSTDDGQLYIENWGCYNRCGADHPGSACSCLPDCYEQQSCCPDYEAYCLDVDSTTDSTTEASSHWWSEDTTADISWTSEEMPTSVTEEPHVTDLAHSPAIATEFIKPTTTTVPPTISPTPTRPQFIRRPVHPNPNIPPEPKVEPIPKKTVQLGTTTTTTTTRTTTTTTAKPVVRYYKPVENEVLRDKPTVQQIKETKAGSTAESTIMIVVGVVSAVVLILVAVKLRRRVVSACDSMRMRRGGACDSQSDVRFLTSDEVLDFSLASSSL